MMRVINYEFEWQVVWDNLPYLLVGVWHTLWLTLLSLAIGLLLGTIIGTMRLSNYKAARWSAYTYLEVIRSVPLLLGLYWIYQVFPVLTGIQLDPIAAGVGYLALNVGAFWSEIWRAGFKSLGTGQREAALALGLAPTQAWRRVLAPQALTRVIPPLGTMWISLFKDSSLLFLIGIHELMYRGQLIAMNTYRPLEIYTAVLVIYFLVALPQARGVDFLYERFRVHV